MYEGGNLQVKHKTFCGAALISNATTNIDTVDNCEWARDSTRSGLFVERGGVNGNVVVDYAVTICLRERVSEWVKMCELMQNRR